MAVPGERKPIDSSAVLTTVVLCALWGLQQTAIKAAAGEISPMLQVALRSGIAALLVLLAVRFVIKDPWNPAVRFADCLKVGIGFTLEFFFVSEGLRFTSAAHMSVLLYTAPLFAAVGLSLKLPEERLSPLQWLGVLIAFTGIAVAFLVPALTGDQPRSSGDLWWLGDLLGLGSGISWGLTTYFMRTTTMNTALTDAFLAASCGVCFSHHHGALHRTDDLFSGTHRLVEFYLSDLLRLICELPRLVPAAENLPCSTLGRPCFCNTAFRGFVRRPYSRGRSRMALCHGVGVRSCRDHPGAGVA